MLFNSVSFLFFFPTVVALFFLIPKRFQWALLLLASAYFYMSFVPWYILVLLFLIVVDYSAGRLMEKAEGRQRTLLLILSICTNLGTLFVFKYFNFFTANIAGFAHVIGWNYSLPSLALLLPLGLSFHVFQSLSYVIEVYRKKYTAEKHLGMYALYVMFFPQLVAGPIERPQQLLPQLHVERSFDMERIKDGLTLMLWGFFKKLVIADQLGVVVDRIYGNLHQTNDAAIVIAVILFAYQLYCDFSGYSDIAVGSARVLGFELVQNFNRPYSARSIAEFWRRWHISLSSWLRDYLYYPLAFSWRKSPVGTYAALFVTFVLIGLWHGANWTFAFMGALHGWYLGFGVATKKWRDGVLHTIGLAESAFLHAIQTSITFALVAVSWVFFRAPTLTDAWYIIASLPRGIVDFFNFHSMTNDVLTISVIGVPAAFLSLRIAAIVFMEFVERYYANYHSLRDALNRLHPAWRIFAYYLVFFWILLLGYFGQRSFIYFQF